jgi:hypothetical protein
VLFALRETLPAGAAASDSHNDHLISE